MNSCNILPLSPLLPTVPAWGFVLLIVGPIAIRVLLIGYLSVILRRPIVVTARIIPRRAAREPAALANDALRLQLSPTTEGPLRDPMESQGDREYGTFEPSSSDIVAESTAAAYEATMAAQELTLAASADAMASDSHT